MSIPCEVAAECVLSVAGAIVAKELVASHVLKKIDATHVLGVSDPLVEIEKCELCVDSKSIRCV